MKSYPIWMDVTSCIYKGSKSYGIKEDGLTRVHVGTSAGNSHHFADIRLTHRDMGDLGRSFHLYIDGQMIKQGIVKNRELSIKTAPSIPDEHASKIQKDFQAASNPQRVQIIQMQPDSWPLSLER